MLQEVIDGITRFGLGQAPPNPDLVDDSDGLVPDDADLAGSVLDEAAEAVDPTTLRDERLRRIALQAQREGQNKFRSAVLEAYDDRCAVTGANVPAALDAAHIAPYRGRKSNMVPNGLALRRDVHSLFDRGMIGVHEDTYEVLLGPVVARSETYSHLAGVRLRLPRLTRDRPSVPALRNHRLFWHLGEP